MPLMRRSMARSTESRLTTATMNSSASRSKSGGWWRLLAGLLLVAAATLGVGFYLPLKKSNQLLADQLATAQNNATELSSSLQSTQAALQQTTQERDELRGFKDQVDARRQRYPETASRLAQEAESPVAEAYSAQLLHARALNDGVAVDWRSTRLFGRKRDSLSASGRRFLCPVIAQLGKQELKTLTIRTFVDSDSDVVPEAMEPAAQLAIAVADDAVSRCRLPRSDISIASSPATRTSPPLSLEFRAAATPHAKL